LDDEERVAPCGKPSTDENPESAVAVTEPWAWRPALQHDQLMTQAKILDDQVRSGFRPRRDRSSCPPDHADSPSPSSTCWESFTGPARRKGRWIEFLRPTGLRSDGLRLTNGRSRSSSRLQQESRKQATKPRQKRVLTALSRRWVDRSPSVSRGLAEGFFFWCLAGGGDFGLVTGGHGNSSGHSFFPGLRSDLTDIAAPSDRMVD
jgi:hypothetical protein